MTDLVTIARNGKGCWYYVETEECVMCGRARVTRERRWTPRPDNPLDRFNFVHVACPEHFL